MNVYSANDPAAPSNTLWHFVYLHGEAEGVASELTYRNNWPDGAADLCVLDGTHPTTPGEYPVTLYGRDAVAVLADRGLSGHLSGRVALMDDADGLAHARNVAEWR